MWKPENRLDRYRLRWNDVKYEPGELRVVVYDDNGKVAGEQTIKTAGKPAALRLQGWSQSSENSPIASLSPMEPISLCSDGLDLAFVTVSLQDKDGNFIPDATDQLRFEVEGAGTFRAACNGDATSLEPFTEPTMKLFAGQLVVVVQAAKQKGTLRLRVIDDERNLSETINIAVK